MLFKQVLKIITEYNLKTKTMTLSNFKKAITANFACADPNNITTAERDAAMNQLPINCAPETVNPNPQRPITRPA